METVTFKLETFEGPLDLLLHLIQKNKVSITDIPIADITRQYLDYLNEMKRFDMEITGEFLVMAAQLLYIKSKMLLPVYEDEADEDPRADLVEALLEYQRIKEAGSVLSIRAQIGRDLFVKGQEPLEKEKHDFVGNYSYEVLTRALEDILQRAQRKLPPSVTAFQGK
mgnify:CR=1 FL=1